MQKKKSLPVSLTRLNASMPSRKEMSRISEYQQPFKTICFKEWTAWYELYDLLHEVWLSKKWVYPEKVVA